MSSFILALLALFGLYHHFASAQFAATVKVGQTGLAFTPNSLTAPVGSQVAFEFYPHNHSLATGAFGSPCQPDGKVFSGYVPVMDGTAPNVFVITINDTNPVWLYCTQNYYTHCQNGMVMVINPPTSGPQLLRAYQAASQGTAAGSSGDLPSVRGGTFQPDTGASAPSSSMSMSMSWSSSAPMFSYSPTAVSISSASGSNSYAPED